jgi:hypothetical protein
MNGEARKLHLKEEILKIENDTVLKEVEAVINRSKMEAMPGKSIRNLAGRMTEEEAEEIKRIIEESCEQINPEDWKLNSDDWK